jgi:hypothetical protein
VEGIAPLTDYLSLRRRKGISTYRIAWVLWIIGTIFIVLSWFGVVSNLVGWGGFAVTLIGTLLSILGNQIAAREAHQSTQTQRAKARPVGIGFEDSFLRIALQDGRVISAPLAWYPALADAPEVQRSNFVLGESDIDWPDINLMVFVADILDGTPPAPTQE